METINIRRSIRNFKNQEVEQEKIEALLRAGMQAPSARNQQPWEFVVVTDKEKLAELANIGPFTKPAGEAAVDLVLVIKTENLTAAPMVDQDMGACTQNILLEAVEQGLGAVWMGVKPIEDRMSAVSKILDLPEGIVPFSLIAIGYSEQENKFVDRYDETRIHYNKY